jgi:hypothetical protein
VNRARHWLEAERLQASGIDRINQILTLQQSHGLWQDAAMDQQQRVADLYFRAAQISALLAQAGPGLDAEVAAIQKERPPMPPPPPRPVESPSFVGTIGSDPGGDVGIVRGPTPATVGPVSRIRTTCCGGTREYPHTPECPSYRPAKGDQL